MRPLLHCSQDQTPCTVKPQKRICIDDEGPRGVAHSSDSNRVGDREPVQAATDNLVIALIPPAGICSRIDDMRLGRQDGFGQSWDYAPVPVDLDRNKYND